MTLRTRILADARRAFYRASSPRSVCPDKNRIGLNAKRTPLRRLVLHGNLVKDCVLRRNCDTVKIEYFPQNLDDDLLIAVDSEFSDIHVSLALLAITVKYGLMIDNPESGLLENVLFQLV